MSLLWPGLFAAGSLCVAGPILIHLLNRRRYRPLDWAAMDFLLEANRRNRRRIRIEDLLLLLLRCAAIVLIALLVARPFQQLTPGAGWLDGDGQHRVVVVDDSLSTTCVVDGQSQFDTATTAIGQWLEQSVDQGSIDSFTLYVASQPQKPVVDAQAVSAENLSDVVTTIAELIASSGTAQLDETLAAIKRSFDDRSAIPNRAIYLFTDLRRRDWAAGDEGRREDGDAETEPADRSDSTVAALRTLAEVSTGTYVVDIADDRVENLAIVDVAARQPLLAAGVAADLDVIVRNLGPNTVRGALVQLKGEGQLPLTEEIDRIAPGDQVTVPFAFVPPPPEDGETLPPPIPIEITVESEEDEDRVAGDSVYYFAARVSRGIQTLIVDGDPAALPSDSESFFLQRALTPPGDLPAGIVVRVVGPSELETVNLQQYQVVYLCNLENISPVRRESLEAWVRQGGGLVLAVGDQLYDPTNFNAELYRDGAGLSPVSLTALAGNEDDSEWMNLNVLEPNHDVLQLYEGESNPLLGLVRVYQWWQVELPEEDPEVRVLARFTDAAQSPAIVERRVEKGRVIAFAWPLDDDWSNWPQEPAGSVFVSLLHDLTRYMARTNSREGQVAAGQRITHPIDLAEFQQAVRLAVPDGQSLALQPTPAAASETSGTAAEDRDEDRWRVTYDATEITGFYRLELKTIDDTRREVLFAANPDPGESDLSRVDQESLADAWEGSNIEIIGSGALNELRTPSVRREWWKYVAVVLAAVLASELLLSWFLGRQRT